MKGIMIGFTIMAKVAVMEFAINNSDDLFLSSTDFESITCPTHKMTKVSESDSLEI
jgi:hypothetical protein